MRILFVFGKKEMTESERFLFDTVSFFDNERFEVKILKEEPKEGFKEFLKAEKPDVVHVCGSMKAETAAKKCGIPLTVKSFDGNRRIFPFFRDTADIVVTDSKAESVRAVKSGISKDRIRTAYGNTFPMKKISTADRENAREKLGACKDDAVIVSALPLENNVDVKGILSAFSGAYKICPNIKMIFPICGALTGSVRNLASDLEISERVVFGEDIADRFSEEDYAESIFNAADIALCTGKHKSEVGVLPYMSIGRPVIASDSSEEAEFIKNGKNGLTYEEGNTDMLSTALLTLAANVNLRKEMSEFAQSHFEERFSQKAKAMRLQYIYENELAKKTKKSEGM